MVKIFKLTQYYIIFKNYISMYEKKLLTIVLLCILNNSRTFSQTTIELSRNSVRIGDVVKKQKLSAKNIWDLSNSKKCSEALDETYEDFKTDTITGLFQGMRKYYTLHSDSLLLVGSENPLIMERFYIPETLCVFPMALGDKHDGFFASHINYCDKMKIHKYGSYTIHADSIGTLVLPNGNAINNALQISRKRKFLYDQVDLDTSADSLSFNEAEISRRHTEADSIYTEVERELYIKGYRYPIVKDYTLYFPQDEPCVRETYFFPPEEQESLSLDEENLQTRRNQEEIENSGNVCDNDNIASFIKKNPDTMEVVFDSGKYIATYPSGETRQCRLLLSDVKGYIYRTSEFMLGYSSAHEVRMSYSGLRRGQYILSLVVNNQIDTMNFIVE